MLLPTIHLERAKQPLVLYFQICPPRLVVDSSDIVLKERYGWFMFLGIYFKGSYLEKFFDRYFCQNRNA